MLELSPSFKKQAKKLNVSEAQIIMADLISIGYTENDAYVIAFQENAALSVQTNASIREKILASQKFKALLKARSERNMSEGVQTETEDLLDKTQTAQLIMQSALKLPVDSKERIEGLMKYSDLMGYKKEDAGDTKDQIMFAFPIKCYQCPLLHSYNEFRKKNGEKELRPVEMDRVIRQADEIIKEAQKNN